MVVAHTEGEEIEFHPHGPFEDERFEAQIASFDVIGVATRDMTIVDIETKAPALVEIEPVEAAHCQMRTPQHALIVQIADIVHAPQGVTHLVATQPQLSPSRHSQAKGQKKNNGSESEHEKN